MREIPLTQGMVALVDDEDYENASRYGWYAHRKRNTWYAATNIGHGRGNTTLLYLHNLLMGDDQSGRTVDHRNGDGLDNRKANLRWATRAQQAMNMRRPSDNKSGFKGVVLNKRNGSWVAHIRVDKRQRHIGVYATSEEAARAYDARAREVFGEYARTNFDED